MKWTLTRILFLVSMMGLYSWAEAQGQGSSITPPSVPVPGASASIAIPSATAIAAAPSAIAPNTAPAVKLKKGRLHSYREWKSQKVQEAVLRLATTKTQIEVKKINHSLRGKTEAASPRDLGLVSLENQMKLDLVALEIAQELTVTDYFAGYLSKFHQEPTLMKEVATKMTTDEVAELMLAYANSIFSTSPSPSRGPRSLREAQK